MSSNVDLSQLAVDRGKTQQPKAATAGRRWLSRYVLPAFIVTAFVCLLGWAAKDTLLPSRPVTVIPVLVARAEVQQTDAPLFQAAGWIEPPARIARCFVARARCHRGVDECGGAVGQAG